MNKPPPGSKEAINKGCKCPVMDNSYGKGYMCMEGVYVYSDRCNLHKEGFAQTSTTPDKEEVIPDGQRRESLPIDTSTEGIAGAD